MIEDVRNGLRECGHEVILQGMFDCMDPLLRTIDNENADLIFNLCDSFQSKRHHESHVAGLFDLTGIPYTGSPPLALALCRHKFFTKRVLSPCKIKLPNAVVFPRKKLKRSLKKLKFPLFVKPLGLEGSDGIARGSFVEDEKHCLERVAFIHRHLDSDALVEDYIDGREIYASVVGNEHLKTFPLRTMKFEHFPEDEPAFATFKAKWDETYRTKWGIKNCFENSLKPEVVKKIQTAAKTAYKALGLRGYGRLDFRLTPDEQLYLIEVNPNPNLARDDELAQSVMKTGMSYAELLNKIMECATLMKNSVRI